MVPMDVTTLSFIGENLADFLVPIFIALLGYLSTKIVAFINAKSEAVKNTTKNETIKTYIDVANSTVVEVVEALNQEVVEGIKRVSADGKLTEEEAKEIKDMAIKRILVILSDEAKDTLSLVFGDIEDYLSTLIESTVRKAKK